MVPALGIVILLLALIAWVLVRGAEGLPGPSATGGGERRAHPRLVDISDRHLRTLGRITSQKETMAAVGDGKSWSRQKVATFVRYNREEQAQGGDRVNYYWGIEIPAGRRTRLVGVVGIHPVAYGKPETDGLYFLTIFLDAGVVGKGIGSAALSEALRRFWEKKDDPVYSDVSLENVASQALMKKVGFEAAGSAEIRGKPYDRFRIAKPKPDSPE